MTYYPQTALLQKNIYVGGGNASNLSDNSTIQVYNIDKGKWYRLPLRYSCRWFAMTVINSYLTLVGGYDPSTRKVTNKLAVYDPLSKAWTYPYHPMLTARWGSAVVTYDIWLLVAGGFDAAWTNLVTVELLNVSTNQWMSTSPLPRPCGYMSSTVDLDYWYLITACKQVFSVFLPNLVSQTDCKYTNSKLWCRLPDTQLENSAAIAFRGSLLAVGGRQDNGTSSTAIHTYQSESEKWTRVGDLPAPRTYCSCIALQSGEMLVVGGESYSLSSRVDVATVLE